MTAPSYAPARLAARSSVRPGAGIAVFGLTTAAFLALVVGSAHLSPADLARFSTFWFLMFLVAPTLLGPIEIELARAIAIAGPGAASTLLRRAWSMATRVVVCLGVAALCLLAQERLMGGSGAMIVCLVAATMGQACGHVLRGTFIGHGRFDLHGSSFALEGIARLVGALVVMSAHGSSVAFAAAAAAASFTPLVFWPAVRRQAGLGRTGTAASACSLSWRSWGPLALSVAGLQWVLASPGLLAAWVGSTGDSAMIATLSVIAFVCRLPAFVFQAVQGPLLRTFSLRVSDGHRVQLRRDLRFIVRGTVLLAGGAAACGAGLAPVLNTMVAKGAPVGRTTVAMLCSGGVMIVGALASQVLVICVHAASRGAGAWAFASVLGMLAATTLPFALDVRIATSFAAGAGCAFVVLAGSAQRSLASSPGA